MSELLSVREDEQLKEICRLLDEAYDYYFENSDGHCKSYEGRVVVDFGNYWERKDKEAPNSVQIYSYVLGPSRNHYFDSISDALETVKRWHRDELAHDYTDDGFSS